MNGRLKLRTMLKKSVSVIVCLAMMAALPMSNTYAEENFSPAVSIAQEELGGSITDSIIGVDFSNYHFVEETDKVVTLDKSFLGTIGVEAGKKEVELYKADGEGDVLRLKAMVSGQKLNTYKGGLKFTERFGLECRVKFGDAASERELFGMKGLTVEGDFAWPVPLLFGADGKIKDSRKTVVGSYEGNTWYTIKADVDTQKQEYRVWIQDDKEETEDIFVKSTLNAGNGEGTWHGCQYSYMLAQKAGNTPSTSNIDVAYFKAGAIREELDGYITESITGLNFKNYQFLKETEGQKTVDNYFVGTIGVEAGKKEAQLVELAGGERVLRLNAMAAGQKINTYKGGLKQTDRFGLECRVKFGDNTSERELFTMKGLAVNGDFAWPAPLVFGADGKIKDSQKNVAGNYEADVWYTVKADVDTQKQEYKVWISNDKAETEDIYVNASLNVNGNWYGCQYSYMMSQKAGASLATSYMDMAYFKAGVIKPKIRNILVSDIEMENGGGILLNPAVVPEDAYRGNLQYVSADSNIVKVFENGLLAVKEGETTVTVSEPVSGKSKQFWVTVGQPEKIWEMKKVDEPVLSIALWSGNRGQINYTEEQIRTIIQSTFGQEPEYYRDMKDDQFIQLVDEDIRGLSTPIQLKTDRYEQLSRYLVLMYHATDQWEYARKAAMILYYQGRYYPYLLLDEGAEIAYGENVVYSFGYLLDAVNKETGSTVWDEIAPEGMTGDEVRKVIAELYLRPMGHLGMDGILKRRLGNLDVYAARTAAVIGSIVNDPYLIRKVIMMYDGMMIGEHYYLDGLWEEGTLSYGEQVSSNIISGIRAIAGYTDPQGYSDPINPEESGLNEKVMGLKLSNTDLTVRWPLLEMTKDMPRYMVYPDGSPIAVNDTHFKKGSDMLPIQEALLRNIELPGFGYYGLVQGNTDNAVHAGLLYQTKQGFFGGSHDHINVLSMTLWGAGTELLPDVGYVTAGNYPDGNGKIRYPSMRPVFGNMPWIFRKDGANEVSDLGWFKPRLLAYDSGSDNEGVVTLVEASDVGADNMQADVNQRLLMNIALDESHSYVFDLSRMQGGDAHEIFQRGSELENMSAKAEGIEFTDTGKSSLSKVEPFSLYESQYTVKDMDYLYDPKEADGSSDFSMVWEGVETGSRITTYMNGVAGSKVYLSSIPSPRRANSRPDEKIFVAPHITRYRESVSGGDLTKYGAVYETARAGEEDRIESVEWVCPEGMDEMGMLGKIISHQFIDYIYTSGDTEIRLYDEISFSGRIAMVRKDRETGKIVYSYMYGQGTAGKYQGSQVQSFEVTGLTTAPVFVKDSSEAADENTITVMGSVNDPQSYIGKRAQLVFGDGSGYGLKVKQIEEKDGYTVITAQDYVPARLTEDGVELLFFPYGQKIAGKVTVILEKGMGTSKDVSGGDVSDGDVSDGDVSDGDGADGDNSEDNEADKSVLYNLVISAGGISREGYSEESFVKLTIALKYAEKVLSDSMVSQKTVNEAAAALLHAINGLIPMIPEIPIHPAGPSGDGSKPGEPEADWNQASKEIRDKIAAVSTQKSREKSGGMPVVNIVTGNKIMIPAEIFSLIKDQNITAAFHTGQGVTFSIGGRQNLGKALTEGMDLSVRSGEGPVPASILKEKTIGTRMNRQISMTYRESFGLIVNLHLSLGKENAEKYANLYLYHEKVKKLEFMGSFPVTSSGQAMFGLRKGGDYLLTVSDHEPGGIYE